MKPRERDSGLQTERTTLSWFRTVFVVLINALLVLKLSYNQEHSYIFISGISLIGFTISLYILSLTRNQKFAFDVELTTKNAIWTKRYISLMVGLCALLVSLSSAISLYNLLLT